MALLNYTSKVAAEQTISEIQKMLARHNISAIMTEYDGPHVSAVSFRMTIGDRPMAFKLPCNWKAVLAIFESKSGNRTIWDAKRAAKIKAEREAQAIRTAWRIIKDWIEAQLALVEVNMVTVPQVFLPYAITRDGRTLAEKMNDEPGLLLGDGQ